MKKGGFEVLRDRAIEAFETPVDRSIAIVGAAYLDETLKDAISSRFIAGISKQDEDRIFKDNGPLTTFAAKIDIAYALGIIGKRSRRDLHLVRKIRNEFAHAAKRTRFSTEEIASRCAELWLPANILMPGARTPPAQARERYTTAVIMLKALIRAEQEQSGSPAKKSKFAP